jgi:TonB family protein
MIQIQELSTAGFYGKNARLYMIAHFVNRALRPLTPIFFFLIAALLWNTLVASPAFSQTAQTQSGTRKAKSSPPPEYPELARKMKIEGIARVLLTVNSDGTVVKVKDLGGNPVLVDALAQAARKWKYEPAERESDIEVRYEFVLSH